MKYVRVEFFFCDCIKCDSTKELGNAIQHKILRDNVYSYLMELIVILLLEINSLIYERLKHMANALVLKYTGFCNYQILNVELSYPSKPSACQLTNIHFE